MISYKDLEDILHFLKGRIIMPHMTVEYTENIETNLNVNELLKEMNESLISHKGLFSPQGIRSRAIKLTDYLIGDGSNNDAFVHITLKIAAGRTEEIKKNVIDHLLDVVNKYFNTISQDNKITISLELLDLGTDGNIYTQI